MTTPWDPDEDGEDDEEFGPGDPDYDLSEQYGYGGWEPRRDHWPVPPWLLIVVSVLVVVGLLVPTLIVIASH